MKKKIKQIIPAIGWRLLFAYPSYDEETQHDSTIYYEHVTCFALTSESNVVPMFNEDGEIRMVEEFVDMDGPIALIGPGESSEWREIADKRARASRRRQSNKTALKRGDLK